MKYLITESQIDKVIFKYLDKQDFIQFNKDDGVYFVNSEDDKYAQIRLKNDGVCFIYTKLVEEISSFFSLGHDDTREIISKWVENTLQTEITHTMGKFFSPQDVFIIP